MKANTSSCNAYANLVAIDFLHETALPQQRQSWPTQHENACIAQQLAQLRPRPIVVDEDTVLWLSDWVGLKMC